MTTPQDLAKLMAVCEAATAGDLDSAPKSGEYGYQETDKWYECPTCDGQGEVHGATYCNFDGVAQGVQFFGIGNEFKNYEAFFRTFNPETVKSLLRIAIEAGKAAEALAALIAIIDDEFGIVAPEMNAAIAAHANLNLALGESHE